MDEELRRLEARADRQARKLARTVTELARLRTETAWSELTPEERRARIRQQSRRAGRGAAAGAVLALVGATMRRPEVSLPVVAAMAMFGLSASSGPADGPVPEPPAIAVPQPTEPPPEPAPVEVAPPSPEPVPAVEAGALPDDTPEPRGSPPPEPRPSPSPTEPPEEPPRDDCPRLTLIDLVVCLPSLDPRS